MACSFLLRSPGGDAHFRVLIPPPMLFGKLGKQMPVPPWTPSCTQAEGTHEYTNTLDGDPQPFRDSQAVTSGEGGQEVVLRTTPSAL